MNTPYGSWPSALSAEQLTKGVKGFADLQCAGSALVLLESRPEEAGRSTLVLIDPMAPDQPGTELTPAPFNVRSRVHEYGGGASLATSKCIFFVDFADQNVYRVALEHGDGQPQPAPPQPITATGADRRYSDFCYLASENQLIAVCEQHSDQSRSPENLLVAIDVASGDEHTLHSGHDFYASPCIHPNQQTLTFVAWDHPNMPWDGTWLYEGTLTEQALENCAPRAGGVSESICQPQWQADGTLVYASDRSGFWNLYCSDAETTRPLNEDHAEYASPAWVFGQREHTAIGAQHTAAVRMENGHAELLLLNREAPGAPHSFTAAHAVYHALCANSTHLFCIAEQVAAFPVVLAIDLDNGQATTLRSAGAFPLDNPSAPTALSVTNRQGLTTHAWLYLPAPETDSSDTPTDTASDSKHERPPLLVLSHGGPTSATSPSLNPRIQYYTSRGWAVVDVNYGGSTGFGRDYRERLKGNWGVTDVQDCEDVALELAARGIVDKQRIAIKGGSAGGYTTLAALTFGDVFAAGASHYGIGDINALAADTHKFEARYVDGLIPRDQWERRSPINSVDQLSCPVIFFQGSQDAVVLPNQAQSMVAALDNKQLPVAYVEFDGEGHGFRQAKNIAFAAAAEYQFFCEVFGIDCPDERVELPIANLRS